MHNMHALLAALVVALGMATTHSFALTTAGYFRYPLLDVFMHAAGGGIIGILAMRIFRSRPMWGATLSALVISIIWEIFEVRIGMTTTPTGYVADTLGDLAAGTVAAIAAVRIMNPKPSYEKR
jgi:hypothetical protein